MPDSPLNVLLVDDDEPIRRIFAKELDHAGLKVRTAEDVAAARASLKEAIPDVVVLDVRLPGESGDRFLGELATSHEELPVIMLTGHADVELAIECMKKGAADFLTKPCSVEHLVIAIRRAAAEQRLREANATLTRHVRARRKGAEAMVGRAPALQRLRGLIERVAPTEEPVLILGESGTGKELIAQEIQRRSRRSEAAFLTVNCAAVTETLLESELFGHEKGAFSGADTRRMGFFELADGGTVFLDEIGDMPLPMQAKLLRVLQSGEVRRVGGSKTMLVDVRVIAATNRDLREAVREGSFREDLLHRINTIVLQAPALRDRLEDLEELIGSFLGEAIRDSSVGAPSFSENSLRALRAYPWPGNIRELRNVVRRAAILATGDVIEPEGLPSHILETSGQSLGDGRDTLDLSMAELERRHFIRVYEAAGRNKAEAARRLGVSVRTLYNKFEAWGIHGDDSPPPEASAG